MDTTSPSTIATESPLATIPLNVTIDVANTQNGRSHRFRVLNMLALGLSAMAFAIALGSLGLARWERQHTGPQVSRVAAQLSALELDMAALWQMMNVEHHRQTDLLQTLRKHPATPSVHEEPSP